MTLPLRLSTKNKNFLFWLIVAFVIIIPLIFSLRSILSGNIAFWYDPARDLLSAWNNLHKITLIGPTSGIPGIFYGPYWIWLLSFGLLFSKDPRIVDIITSTLPYFLLFPIVLYTFKNMFGRKTIIILWLLFILNIGMTYATSMWNLNSAALLFLFLTSLFVHNDYTQQTLKDNLRWFLAGIVEALIINFDISFGIAIFFSILLFFLFDYIRTGMHKKEKWMKLFLSRFRILFFFFIGMLIIFLPFFFFESRHGFQQTHTALNAFLKYGNVVTIKGLSKEQIIQAFFDRFGVFLGLNAVFTYVIELIAVMYLFYLLKIKKMKLKDEEIKLLSFLSATIVGILFIYLTARNPVWQYHFFGVEIIFLLLFGLLISKNFYLQTIVGIWAVVLLISASFSFITHSIDKDYTSSSLFIEENIVNTVARDAGNTSYTVFDYSPSIYTYEFTYLFKWMANKDVPYDPGSIPTGSPLVYVIIPTVSQTVQANFINYRTPNKEYRTIKTWKISDGSVILKRGLRSTK